MSKTEAAYLTDMLSYARKARAMIDGISRQEFDENDTLQFALAYVVMIIGEAAHRLSPEMRNRLPQLPWPDIIGMRHRLVHGYGSVSWSIVWDTVTDDLPPLITALEKITPPEPPSA